MGIRLGIRPLPVGRFDVPLQIGYNGAVPGRSAGVARMVWDHEVGGSNPLAPTTDVERDVGSEKRRG